ncbi:MAG: hypothetical protein ACLSUW_01830 [Akkermansia sp.]
MQVPYFPCPDKCDHARDFAVFRIVKYLDYRKPGKYGDEKQEQLMVDVNPAHVHPAECGYFEEDIALEPGTRWFFTGLIIICTGSVLSRNVP